MKPKYLLAMILLSVLGSLGAESWTMLVYMAADNNLAQMGALDINSMESVVKPAGLNVIVQADFPDGAKRYHIRKDNSDSITSPVISDLGQVDSGDPQTLNDFLRWGVVNYPAQRKMLVIWSHGDSWYKEGDSKWICPDDGAQSLMSIARGDLATAFYGIPKLDILLFDACSMQSLEVLSEVEYYASYVIGSEELVPQYGFPYERIIPLMGEPLDTILYQIPQQYVQSYMPGEGINPGNTVWTATCSTVATTQLPNLRSSFSNAMNHYLPFAEQMAKLRQQCYEMNTGLADVDFKQLLQKMDALLPGSIYLSALQSQWDAMVVWAAFSSPEPLAQDIGTAALWFPDNEFNFTNGWLHYWQLVFAQTNWLGMVNAVLGNDNTPPEPPQLLSKAVIYNTLRLQLKPAPDPDVLQYELQTDEGTTSQYVWSDTFVDSFTMDIGVSSSGVFSLWAIDRAGNRSTALNGTYTWTEPKGSCRISPNPVMSRNVAALDWWTDEAGQGTLELFNIRGQTVMQINLGELDAGTGMELLSARPEFARLAAGIYLVRLSIGPRKYCAKMTILR